MSFMGGKSVLGGETLHWSCILTFSCLPLYSMG